MRNGYKLTINTQQCIGRFNPKYSAAQKFLDNEVVKDCTPYVPMRTGDLYRSGITGTSIGSGKVNYIAPYAKAMYYGLRYKFSKDKHPLACAQWFEAGKSVYLKVWINGVNQIVKG